ncbi:MAG: UDP-2,3-diacylglucosamine diphosphatase [Gammaproteobacteria bacterium]|nr:MAG: UDP-2,3-diacylglucosamine diphosphatase [Gammaproteobacteria bacterium]
MSCYFISDLHLETERPDITRAFLRWCQDLPTSTQSLYILGDFFEVWVGDDYQNELIQTIKQQLRALSDKGIDLAVMHGNRDFLLGQEFADQIGCRMLQDPTVETILGKQVLLMHGDSLCTKDLEYMQFRQQIRDPNWQANFLTKPLEERLAIAQQLRAASQQKNSDKQTYLMDVTDSEVVKVMQDHQVDTLIHGHTHRPKQHSLQVDDRTCTRWVLGDWHQDLWALEFDGQTFNPHVIPLAQF